MIFDCFLAQLLVLAMIFFSSSRIFLMKKARVDCFVAFSPMALLVSIIILFCFGFTVQNFSVFLLSLLVFFTNFRSILRLAAKLIVDSYSIIFIIFSILNIILSILLAIFIVNYRPVKISANDFNVVKKQFILTGNTSNIRIRESFFSGEKFSGNLYSYEPIVHDDIVKEVYSANPVIIFVPGIRSSSLNYEAYFMLLAQKGYKVLSADFYTSDSQLIKNHFSNKTFGEIAETKIFREFLARYIEKFYPDEFSKILTKEKSGISKKYSALTKLALELYGDTTKVFYIIDGVDFDSIYSVIDEYNTEPYFNAQGFFSMNRVNEFKTSGYGFIEHTNIYLARKKGIEREKDFFIPRYMASKTIQQIMEQ